MMSLANIHLSHNNGSGIDKTFTLRLPALSEMYTTGCAVAWDPSGCPHAVKNNPQTVQH